MFSLEYAIFQTKVDKTFYLLSAFQPSLWLTLGGAFMITSVVYATINSAGCHTKDKNKTCSSRWQQFLTDVWFITESWLLQSKHFFKFLT